MHFLYHSKFTLLTLLMILPSVLFCKEIDNSITKIDTIPELIIPNYSGRNNEIQDSIKFNTNEILLYGWDQGVIDGDKIKVTQFEISKNLAINEKNVGQLDLIRKKKRCGLIKLEKRTDIYLRVDALTMGSEKSHNSAFIQFTNNTKKKRKRKKSKKQYILNVDAEKSALFKLVYDPNIDGPFEEFKDNEKYIDTLILNKKSTKLFISINGVKKFHLNLKVDSKSRINKWIKNDKETPIPIGNFANDKSNNLIKISKIRTNILRKSTIEIKVKKKDGYETLTTFNAEENFDYLIPIKILDPRKPDKKIIYVNSTDIKIELSDPDKIDKDIISIIKNDTISTISKYELKKEKHEIDVSLNPNNSNYFKFISDSEGDIGANTAYVVIKDKSGEQIASFSLKSFDGKPATLIIVHDSNYSGKQKE